MTSLEHNSHFFTAPRSRRSLVAVLVLSLGIAGLVNQSLAQSPANGKLSAKELAMIEHEIVPLFQMANTLQLLQSLSDLTKKMKADELADVDETLAGFGLPTAGQLLTESRLALIKQGWANQLPRPRLREVLLTVPVLRDAARETLIAAESHPVLTESFEKPVTLEGFEQLFWDLHVLENKMETARQMCAYGAELVMVGGTTRTEGLEDADLDLLDINFTATAEQIEKVYLKLQERRLELRLDRLERAEIVLQTSDSFMERLRAAFVADLDSELLLETFAANGQVPHFQRDRLRSPELPEQLAERTDRLRELSGDLTTKARLFFQGLHWWVRGRYGRGPDGGGLLKSPAALRDPRVLFGLFMPEQIAPPKKNLDVSRESASLKLAGSYDPKEYYGDGNQIKQRGQEYALRPDYDRRHHYIWTYEYRRPGPNVYQERSFRRVSGSSQPTTRTTLSRFY